MSADDVEHAAAVALPSSPALGTKDIDAPNMLDAVTVQNGSAAGDASSATKHTENGTASNGTLEPSEQDAHFTEPVAEADTDSGAVNGKVDDHLPHPTNRSKVLPMPDEDPSTPMPPTPSTKRAPSRTDSLPSLHRQSIASPRPVPVPMGSASRGTFSNGRGSPALAPPTPGTPGTHNRSMTMARTHAHAVPTVILSSALDTIASSREAKRAGPLKDSAQLALELVRSGEAGDRPRDIFEPLRLVCEMQNEKLMITSLDCISKLNSYSLFLEPLSQDGSGHQLASPPASPAVTASIAGGSQESISQPTLVDLVVHTVTSCHTETTADSVSVQIVKALLALITSSTLLVHQSSLLKAVRTVYNIFLLSTDPGTQTAAQAGLTQMVHHVFTRCRIDQPDGIDDEPVSMSTAGDSTASLSDVSSPRVKDKALSAAPPTPPADPQSSSPPPASQDAGNEEQAEQDLNPASVRAHSIDGNEPAADDDQHDRRSSYSAQAKAHRQLSTNDMFIKDAFLVFRALCKLTMKPLATESERDLRSHPMRSKLLALHLVLDVLDSHMPLLVAPSSLIYSLSSNETTSFVQAVNQYLCLCLSRNAVSLVPQVFEISVEIFWRVLSGMRTKLKKEIEVLLHEIFIPILEMKTSTLKQKGVILGMFSRLFQDPQALVEIYLNYDCDSEAVDNIYEHLANVVSKLASAPLSLTSGKGAEQPNPPATGNAGPSERHLKKQGLEALVAILKSLVVWGTASTKSAPEAPPDPTTRSRTSEDNRPETLTPDPSTDRLSLSMHNDLARLTSPTVELADDPMKFENAKHKKTTLLEGIRKFNLKPKRGVEFFLETGFIKNKNPREIAAFLLNTDGLSKAMIGEYLGEGEEANIATMQAFVDLLDFRNLPFVEALRLFLQSFRLPGEAQKIDRFMLKFAERYMEGNPHTPFATAETAYVLSYSVVLLNTDHYNPQVKRRMTKAEFIKNNREINDGRDLPEELLLSIYDDIASNEIRMKDEVALAMPTAAPGFAGALANVGRDLQREAYVMQSHGMANKTEAMFKSLLRSQRRGSKGSEQFFSASHFVHVKPMFEVAWISFLAGISGPLQESDDLETVELCLDGFKAAIRIVCHFDLELERNAFVTTLAKFTFLNNLGEMKTKNMEAIKTLLDVAVTEGNNLKGSWHEVLGCVSQLEHMQLLSSGADMPDVKRGSRRPAEELANESRSTHITVAADMVFSLSHYLSGTAIVDFVQALCDVSWEEISSSGLSQNPRMFSLQKLVEISYYNMNRIRLEWSQLWGILGEHFNQVCCYSNPRVGFFALDALRQLAMRFLEKDELSHFQFQKDFLKPFEYTMVHNDNPDIRDMVLQCLQQMVQARAQNIRSGWRTMFGVFSAASKVLTERIVGSAFEIVTRLNNEHFAAIVRYGSFADLTVCITHFCKASKFQKISLLAIAMLRGVIPVMLETPECGLSEGRAPTSPSSLDDPMIKFWFPVLFSYYDIIMNGEDLEVRRLALDSLFSTLKTHGASFPVEFWDTVCQELLFPIFAVLKSSQDLSRFSTQEDMSVWLSTTMIQALRDLIDLYTHFFETLERFLDGLLELLCVCICQENDTLARIGTSCLQQLLENNVRKLSPAKWERVVSTFVKLFRTTTPHQLFDDNLRADLDGNSSEMSEADADNQTIVPAPLGSPGGERPGAKMSHNDRRRIFKQIIVKCVLQLLLIETTNDLLRSEEVYTTIPPEHLLRLMGVLDHSYQFARMFNEDKDLRTGLWKVGFMKHLPNLLKQESSSAATLVHVLCRMYYDPRPEHQAARPQIADRLLPLGLGVLQDYNKLRGDTQAKNIAAWTPVVAEIVHGLCRFDEKAFSRYLPAIYPLVVELLARDVSPEVRQAIRQFFTRVGVSQGVIEA